MIYLKNLREMNVKCMDGMNNMTHLVQLALPKKITRE